VRTNAKEFVDVRPAFGVLWRSREDDSIATLNIRYKGKPEDLGKIKLQVSWIWGILPDELKGKKLSHS